MFHGKHFERAVARAGERAGLHLNADQVDLLGAYADWRAWEAVAAGGIGPAEPERITDRHIADSLVFAAAWRETPLDLLDVGSGVGLPGIPLAIASPGTAVTLLDRSGERCRLARRAVRVLGLENVTVVQGDVEQQEGGREFVAFRASLSPERALRAAIPLLTSGGSAVVAASRTVKPPTIPRVDESGVMVDLLEIEPGVLDSPAWLLRMTLVESPRVNGSLT
jgi:16S rRNA (guanine527-N7)-methyltransferase